MQRRRPSLNKDHDCYDLELYFDKILTNLSFIRINIDSIVLPEGNSFIERLYREGSLYGFNLEYQFPCLENVSRSLRAPVRIPAKSFTMTEVQFRHRRVVLLQMNPDIVPFWSRNSLKIWLHVQLNTRGKFSTRLLAYCVVPLAELLISPFLICRDFHFIAAKGTVFEGSSLIRIDLGTRDNKLSDKLNELRDPLLGSTYVVEGISSKIYSGDRNRSRSASLDRCYHHSTENRAPHPTSPHQVNIYAHRNVEKPMPRKVPAQSLQTPTPLRERVSSNLTEISDSVFEDHITARDTSHALGMNSGNRRPYASDILREFRPAVRSSTSSSVKGRERESPLRKCLIQLDVHEARGLPLVKDDRNRLISPNAYISVLGRDGELRSSICERSRRPLWNWTARFLICGERRNIIVKVFHHDISGDKTLGFVSIPLPIEEAHRVDYEMVDLTGTANLNGEIPIITMSIGTSDIISRPSSGSRIQSSSSSWAEQQAAFRTASPHLRSTTIDSSRFHYGNDDHPIITATREELAEKLKRNLSDLDRLIRTIKE